MRNLGPILLVTLIACSSESEFFESPLNPDNEVCPDPSVALPTGYRFIDSVSKSEIHDIGPNTIHVDATAGGFVNAADNPFLYISFASGSPKKVSITDLDAFSSTEWDIAFKRIVIRANGGDSGPAGIEVASSSSIVGGAVSPDKEAYRVDDFATEDCELQQGPIGEPVTAFGAWYQYDQEKNRVETDDRVFFLKRQDRTIRIEFDSYYGVDGTSESANYILRWSIE